MKDFLIAVCIFGFIVFGIVFATQDEFLNNRPAVSSSAANPAPVCNQPITKALPHRSPAVKVIKTVKIIQVPVTRVYVREVYHTEIQQIVNIRSDNVPAAQTSFYIKQMQFLSSQKPYDPEIEEDYQRLRVRLGL